MSEEAIIDSSAVDQYDKSGVAIPVTIPIDLGNGLTVVYTTRLGGSDPTGKLGCSMVYPSASNQDDSLQATRMREAQNHRGRLTQVIGRSISLTHQVHGNTVLDVDEVWNERIGQDQVRQEQKLQYQIQHQLGQDQYEQALMSDFLDADADSQVTSRKDVALGVYVADCLPVFLADPSSGVIAAVHAGRRSLVGGVIEKTLDAMVVKGADLHKMVVAYGPSICGDCYEVGSELADEFEDQFEGSYTLTRFGGPGIDLLAAVRNVLSRYGIESTQYVDARARIRAATQYLSEDEELSNLCLNDGLGDPLGKRLSTIRHSMCTMENPLWYSHRLATIAQQAEEGRMICLIMQSSKAVS